ncbi:hypothetical protein [Microbacterium sp.]|uniref:hypothetical protein n=1 Tax=Microbacterium sp. TaxID=51671 RepID=UPI0026369A67|nr:hypothetical protein [Microbacterium sp.]
MKRTTYNATTYVDDGSGRYVGSVDKYAHNSAKRAGEDFLRDYGDGPWEIDPRASVRSGEYEAAQGYAFHVIEYTNPRGVRARVRIEWEV